jgi:gliding motility-associated-like protein
LNEPSEIIVDLVALDADCGVQNGSIQSNVLGGTAPYSYTWSNSTFGSDLVNIASGQYDLLLEDSNGCSVSSEIVVGSNPLPSITWNVNDVSCYGLSDASISCEVSGFSNELTWTWSPNVASTSLADNLSVGVYQVTAALNQDCFSSVSIEIFNPLQLEVNVMEPVVEFYTGEMAVVDASAFGGVGNYSYSWNISVDQDASAAWLLDSTAWVFVTVTDENGCTAEDSLLIIGVDRENLSTEIFIPNSFSPNDDGLNDVFYPVVNGGKIDQLSIFNRWGNLIFNGFGEAAQWYGNVNEGEYYAEDGSYTFQVQYTDAAGGRKEVKGHVILLR